MIYNNTIKTGIKELWYKVLMYEDIVEDFNVYDHTYDKILTAETNIDRTIYFLHDLLNKDVNVITKIINNKLNYFNNEVLFIDYINITDKINIKNIKNKLYTTLHYMECLIELYYNTIDNKDVNSNILYLYIINMVNSFDILTNDRRFDM